MVDNREINISIRTSKSKSAIKKITLGELWTLAKDPDSGVTFEVIKEQHKMQTVHEQDTLD